MGQRKIRHAQFVRILITSKSIAMNASKELSENHRKFGLFSLNDWHTEPVHRASYGTFHLRVHQHIYSFSSHTERMTAIGIFKTWIILKVSPSPCAFLSRGVEYCICFKPIPQWYWMTSEDYDQCSQSWRDTTICIERIGMQARCRAELCQFHLLFNNIQQMYYYTLWGWTPSSHELNYSNNWMIEWFST